MDKKYYIGYINHLVSKSICYHSGIKCSSPTSELDYYVYNRRLPRFNKCYIEVKEPNIIKILDKNAEKNFDDSLRDDEVYIIFEIVVDKMNNIYAKEIVTGSIFPIMGYSDFTRTYDAKVFVRDTSIDQFNKGYAFDYDFDAVEKSYPINPNIPLLHYFIKKKEYRIATSKEVQIYTESFIKKGKLGFKRKNKETYNKITELYINNRYQSNEFTDFVEENKEEKTREQFDPSTKIMENIEFLLIQIGKINMDLKLNMDKKYKLLLEQENKELTLSPLTLESLKALEAELEFIIKFQKKQDDNIISCLDNIISEYENDGKSERTIEDIDKLSELFFKMKNSYSLVTQRKIIEKFANLYILEIYENRDNIKLEDLSNSYFNDILKSIIIYITSMIENNIIENNIIIDYSNITPEYVLNLIKQIKFTQINSKQKNLKVSLKD